jgi:hypothetical protein
MPKILAVKLNDLHMHISDSHPPSISARLAQYGAEAHER